MGTYYQNIECYLICRSEEELLAAFAHAEVCFEDVFTLNDFVRVGPSYAMMKMPMGMPYSMADGVEGYLLELIGAGLWGQYILKNEELGIYEHQKFRAPAGVFKVIPPSPVKNSPGFASYFVPWEGTRRFSSGKKDVFVKVVHGTVDGTDYFYYEPVAGTDQKRFPLNFAFFRIEENSIFTVDMYYGQKENMQKGTFGDDFYLEEIFATDDPNLNQSAFILSEESGFSYHKFEFRTQAELKINEELFEDVIVIRGQYIHGNCYAYQGEGKLDFEHYIEETPDCYLYFQKEKGIVGYKWLGEEGSWKEYAMVDWEVGNANLNPFEEAVPAKGKDKNGLTASEPDPKNDPSQPKKKGFWQRLFGGD